MSGDGPVKDLNSKEELDDLLRGQNAAVLQFWTSSCETSKQMDQVFCHLSTDFPYANFFRVVDTLKGADPASLANKVAKIAGSLNEAESAAPASLGMAAGPAILEAVKELSSENTVPSVENSSSGLYDSLTSRIKKLMDSHAVFMFMKGTPDQSQCDFSKKVVDILIQEGVEFGSFDVLLDKEVYEGMKKISNCSIFPQLFFKGDFIGDCDMATVMHESGELKEILRDHFVESKDYGTVDAMGISSSLGYRLKSIVKSNPVMLFMRGTPEEPRCSFSGKAVEILQQERVQFGTFDVLSDDEVHEGLKVFSNWSSYPQLYIKGELIGGYDIMLEMEKSGELKRILSEKGIIIDEPL